MTQVPASSHGGGGVSTVQRAVTAAEIIALWTTPITLLAAPGAGFVNFPLAGFVGFRPGGVQFTGGAALLVNIGSPAWIGVVCAKSVITGAVATLAGMDYVVNSFGTSIGTGDLALFENMPLVFDMDHTEVLASAYAAGNGTLKVSVPYVTFAL